MDHPLNVDGAKVLMDGENHHMILEVDGSREFIPRNSGVKSSPPRAGSDALLIDRANHFTTIENKEREEERTDSLR